MLTVYTALFGIRDKLQPPLWTGPGVRYVCYTDQKSNRAEGVETIMVQPKLPCRSRSAKWHKTHPPAGDSLWIDGVFQLIADPRPILDALPGDVAMRPHSSKTCAYMEAIQCAARKSDFAHVILRQAQHYAKDGFPQAFGMWEGGCIFRRAGCDKTWQEAWWQELYQGSCRDQISLPYVAWKLGVNITPLPWLAGEGILKQHKHLDIIHPKPTKRSWMPSKGKK